MTRTERSRVWRRANPERHKALSRAWYKAHAQEVRDRSRAWYQTNPTRARARAKAFYENPANKAAKLARNRAWYLKRTFGIDERQYQAMFDRQGGVCAICGRPPGKRRLAVEHDHGPSKRVRGLCCWHCNSLKIGKNTAETARKVLAYLESDFDGRKL